jgi:hypothetical protein
MTRLQSAFVITASLIGIAVVSTLPASAQQNINPVPPGYDTRILTVDPGLWCFAPMCDRSRYTQKFENAPVYNPQLRRVQRNSKGFKIQ